MLTSARRRPRLALSLSWVAVAIALSGLLTYGYLAVVTRSLPSAEYSWFGAFWSLALVIGFGAFLPVEVELARLLHLRGGARPLPPGTVLAVAGVLTLALAAVLGCAPLLLPALGREPGLYGALLLLCGISAVQFTLRGVLLGRQGYGTHGVVMLVDAALRVAGAVTVALVFSARTAAAYGWTLPIAIGLVHAPVLARELLTRRAAPPAADAAPQPRAATVRAVGHLLVGCLGAQVLLNVIPVVVAGIAAPSQQVLAARFVASFTLVRLPLFVAVPLQSALVPSLTDLHGRGDRRALRAVVLRLLGGTVALAAAGAAVGWLAGPPVVGLLFGRRYALPGGDLAVMAAGACLYAGMLVCGQALVAAGRHRASAAAWCCGLLAAVVVFAVVPGLVARASLAFTAGCAAALAAAAVLLLRAPQTGDAAASGGPALEGVLPAGPA